MLGSKPRVIPVPLVLAALALPVTAVAQPGLSVVQNPNANPSPDPVVIDLGAPRAPVVSEQGPSFSDLDDYATNTPAPALPSSQEPHQVADGLVQVGSMFVPEAMLEGADMVPDASRSLTARTGPVAGGGPPDLEEICAFPDEVPAGIYDYDPRPGGETPRFGTVYLNYLGGTLSSGGENSAENISGIARTGHPYPVYSGGEERAIAAAQAVAADFEDWAVRVVYEERPPKVLPYTMVMMGGSYSDTTAGPSGGVAPLDCEDFGQRNVCYMFLPGQTATTQANVASQEIGHTLGLGHTTASDSVMASGYAPTQGGDLGFNDSCAETIAVQGQGAHCIGVNRCHCGVPDAQHDKSTLSATFAPAGVDMVEPTIEITGPEDGAMFEPGADIFIQVDPWDDYGGYGWKLVLEDANTGEVLADKVDYDKALEFKLIGVPVGTYRATAHIQDHADHVTTDEITFIVGDASAGTGGADESGGGDSSGGEPTSGTGGASGSAGEGGGSDATDSQGDGSGGSGGSDSAGGLDGADDGCGCATEHPSRGAAFLLFPLALLGLRRRR